MSSKFNELVPNKKQELETKEETTQQAKFYKPETDILETEQELLVTMDLPGVAKDAVEIRLEKNTLQVEGRIDLKRYESLKAQYAEYNLGHFTRSFQLSSEINQERISAQMEQGVLTLTLPKVEQAKPKQIAVA